MNSKGFNKLESMILDLLISILFFLYFETRFTTPSPFPIPNIILIHPILYESGQENYLAECFSVGRIHSHLNFHYQYSPY